MVGRISQGEQLFRGLKAAQARARAELKVLAGTLDQELAESAWLTCDVDPLLIFGVPPDEMWEAAIRRLGTDPAALQASSGVH